MEHQHRAHDRAQNHGGFTLRGRFVHAVFKSETTTWLNKTALFTEFHECSIVYIGETGQKNMTETSNSPVPRPPLFQSMPTTPNTIHFGMR